VRLVPRSLAGRLAALLVLTLIVAQIITFAMFTGERIAAFRAAYRDNLLARLTALVTLLEEAPPEYRDQILATAGSSLFRLGLTREPAIEPEDDARGVQLSIATALGKSDEEVRIAFRERHWHRREFRDGNGPSHAWVVVSIHLSTGDWLNVSADHPPTPPLGKAFVASFLISALAVAAVGALGVRFASRPLRQLASAADRLGRGESFEPLPERGPQEMRRANAAFNQMRERLDRFIRDRTAMLAAVGHDLRTPITSLRLRAEFIEDAEVRAKVLETVAEMQAMAEAALAFARGDAEGEASRPTDVAALVESIVEDAAESGRDVTMTEAAPVTLACRPFALRRAIGNIIDNAAFYGSRARVGVESGANDVRIVIDDDGPGIPEADRERVFDPFVRLEGSRSRETGGVGLGLSIARSIVRAHGGDVHLENRQEGGLKAVVSLPR
jgi:signal transduction histidine kinase